MNSLKIYVLVLVKNFLRSLRYFFFLIFIIYDKGCFLRISELVNFFCFKLLNSFIFLMWNDNEEYNLEINYF